jgi:hypothetical protein
MCFLVHFSVCIPLQIVILNNFEKCRSPSKINPCTMSGPEIGKKVLESCNVQNVNNQMNAVVGAHMKRYRNKWQATAKQSQLV